MRTFRLLTTVMMIFTLVLSSVQTVRAEPTPPLPSAFHGLVQFYDSPPLAGDLVYAYVPGTASPVASAAISTYGSDLVYAISVPGDISDTTGVKEGGAPGDTITFIINGRQVATAPWVEGTSVTLNIHPPQALPGGAYTGEAGAYIALSGSANDHGDDASLYEWELDGDALYDDATTQYASYYNNTAGTYTIGLRVTDAQGGVGTASTTVFVYTLGGVSGQVYDGNPHPVTVSGVQTPYTTSITYNGSATAPTNAGTYAVVVGIYNGATLVATINASLVIAPLAASVTPNAAGKIYGDEDPALTGVLSGFLPADGVSATYSRTAGETVAGSPYTISATLSATGLLSNYTITYNTANFTIATRAITVNAEAKTKVYGEADPALTYTYTGTLVGTDAFSGALSREPGSDVGTYAILQNTLTLGTNYAITYNPANFSITPAAATITLAGLSQTYDGTPRVVTATTVPEGLTVTITYNGSTTAPTDAGTYAIVATITNTNYAGTTNGSLVVAQAPSVTTVTGGTFGYDGLPHPATVTVTGVGGLSLTPTAIYSGACSAAPVNVADTPCTASYTYTGDTNHLGSSDSDTIVITSRPITVTADPQTKVYGNADPTLTYRVTSGSLASGDSFVGNLSRDTGEAVGPYNIIQGSLAVNSNYAITYVGDTLTITLRPITITADNKSKIIGTGDPALTYSITDGSLAFSDTVSGSLVRDAGEAIGTYAIRQGSVGLNANYNLTFVNGVFEITGVQHSLVLQPGWNLVSFAIHPASTLVTDIFAPINGSFDLVYAWDANAAPAAAWLKYDNVLISPDNLVNLTETMGFWIHITAVSPVTLTVSGTLPTTTSIPLYINGGGWNLIGYPSDTSASLPGALTSLEPNYNLVFSYRALDAVDPWKMYDRLAPPYASDLAEMAPGWGYWIKVSALDTLEVAY